MLRPRIDLSLSGGESNIDARHEVIICYMMKRNLH
jgi:hypothetical protein